MKNDSVDADQPVDVLTREREADVRLQSPHAIMEPKSEVTWESTGFFSRMTRVEEKPSDESAGRVRPRSSLLDEPKLFFPLRLKLALSFSLLLLIMSGVVAHFLIRYEKVFLQQEAEKRVKSLAANLAANARDPLLADEPLLVGPVVESTMLGGDVLYSYVVNHLDRIVYHSNPKLIGRAPASVKHTMSDQTVIEIKNPVRVEGVLIGTAVVAVGTDHIKDALEATLFGVLVPLVLSTVIGIAGIFFLTGFHMKKIGTLLKAVDEVGRGNLKIRVSDGSRDEVGRLANRFDLMVERIEDGQGALAKNFKETISALAAAVEARDAYTRGHCDRVARISRALGVQLELDQETLNNLELAAILHDIGKIGTEQKVLGKKGVLGREERGKMQMHTDIGAKILEPLSFLETVSVYVRHHHEKFGGGGYPDNLAGDAIPLPSRIIALVDSFDAMITDRAYRRALTKKKALERIQEGIGDQFDPVLVGVFLDMDQKGLIDRICSEVEEGRA